MFRVICHVEQTWETGLKATIFIGVWEWKQMNSHSKVGEITGTCQGPILPHLTVRIIRSRHAPQPSYSAAFIKHLGNGEDTSSGVKAQI